MNERPVWIVAALAASAVLALAACAALLSVARAEEQVAAESRLAAWQVSQVLEDARRILREAADSRLRGELP